MGYIQRTKREKRRIRWSDTSKTTKTFIYTIITILAFSIIIILFSWGFTSLIKSVGNGEEM